MKLWRNSFYLNGVITAGIQHILNGSPLIRHRTVPFPAEHPRHPIEAADRVNVPIQRARSHPTPAIPHRLNEFPRVRDRVVDLRRLQALLPVEPAHHVNLTIHQAWGAVGALRIHRRHETPLIFARGVALDGGLSRLSYTDSYLPIITAFHIKTSKIEWKEWRGKCSGASRDSPSYPPIA